MDVRLVGAWPNEYDPCRILGYPLADGGKRGHRSLTACADGGPRAPGRPGCQLTGLDGSDGRWASDQVGFVDANATQMQPGTGTFTSQQLASGATCADVLSALPSP